MNINSVVCLAVVAAWVDASHSLAILETLSRCPALTTAHASPRVSYKKARPERSKASPLSQARLHRSILTQALPRPAGNLGSGEFQQDVDGMTGDAEADRREHGSEQRDRRHRIERPRLNWSFPKRHRASGRNEHIGDGVVMAADAPQSDTAPGIENFAIRRGEKQQADERPAVRHQTRLIVVQDPAAARYRPGLRCVSVVPRVKMLGPATQEATTVPHSIVARAVDQKSAAALFWSPGRRDCQEIDDRRDQRRASFATAALS